MKGGSGSGEWPRVKVRCNMVGKVTLGFRMSRVESRGRPSRNALGMQEYLHLDDQLHDQFVAIKALVGEVQHAESKFSKITSLVSVPRISVHFSGVLTRLIRFMNL